MTESGKTPGQRTPEAQIYCFSRPLLQVLSASEPDSARSRANSFASPLTRNLCCPINQLVRWAIYCAAGSRTLVTPLPGIPNVMTPANSFRDTRKSARFSATLLYHYTFPNANVASSHRSRVGLLLAHDGLACVTFPHSGRAS